MSHLLCYHDQLKMVILLFNYWTNDPAQIIQSPFVFDHRFFSLWTFNISLRASKKKWWATILSILSELPRGFKLSMWVQMTLVWKSHSYFLTQNREQDWLSLAVMKLRVWSDSHHSEICKGLILIISISSGLSLPGDISTTNHFHNLTNSMVLRLKEQKYS